MHMQSFKKGSSEKIWGLDVDILISLNELGDSAPRAVRCRAANFRASQAVV